MTSVILSLGSNLGDRQWYLQQAREKIGRRIGMITKFSSEYRNEAVGYMSTNTYLNQVLEVETDMSPETILTVSQSIENELGRVRNPVARYSDRTIDIDILFYGSEIIDTANLKIPHPEIAYRDFLLILLKEIIPEIEHPLTRMSIKEMCEKK